KLVGPLCEGRFSTYVDGHIIFVTPLLLAQVLGLPNTGNKLFSCDDFRYFNFDPCAALSRWTGKTFTDHAVTDALSLPDHLKVFHLFLTRVLLPRSLGRDLVTPLDTWLIHCATMGIPVNFCCLMFATMANYGIPDYEGSLPFRPQICTLIAKLGIPLNYKFSEPTSVEYLRAQHVLRRVGWSKCVPVPVNVSGEKFATTVLGWMLMLLTAPRATQEHDSLCGVITTTHLTLWRVPTIIFNSAQFVF
ncbi:hypothetical protein LINPERPRIM_LOCUS38507, partial [Linum perenne]